MSLINIDNVTTDGRVIHDHYRHLVRLLNSSYDAISVNDPRRVKAILIELQDYTACLFGAEENLMQRYDFPSYASHRQEHVHLSRRMDEFLAKLDAGEPLYNIQIVTFLKEWLVSHIRSDGELAGHLVRKGARNQGSTLVEAGNDRPVPWAN